MVGSGRLEVRVSSLLGQVEVWSGRGQVTSGRDRVGSKSGRGRVRSGRGQVIVGSDRGRVGSKSFKELSALRNPSL